MCNISLIRGLYSSLCIISLPIHSIYVAYHIIGGIVPIYSLFVAYIVPLPLNKHSNTYTIVIYYIYRDIRARTYHYKVFYHLMGVYSKL